MSIRHRKRLLDCHVNEDGEIEYGWGRSDKAEGEAGEKVPTYNPSQHAATSGPTREEAEAWLKTKGLSKDEVDLIVIYVFNFGRETKPSIRTVADAFGRKKREWVAQTLKQPAVRECCLIVKFCHNTGEPLPAVESVSGLPQPDEIDAYVTRTVGKAVVESVNASNILEVAKNPAMLLKRRLQISHCPDDHPQRHSGNNSLIGCAASAKEMLKPGGFYRDGMGKFVDLKFPRGRVAQFPPSSPGVSSMFSESEFGQAEAGTKGDAGNEEVIEDIERRLYGRIAGSWQFTAHRLIEAITARAIEVPQAPTEIERLNQLLSGGSLLDQFKEITLPEEAAWMVERDMPRQLDEERIRLNRLILEAAFPKQCPRNRYIRFLGRKLEPEDVVPIIRMNPSWLLQAEWRLILEALVDLLEGRFYGDSARRVLGIAATGSRKRVSSVANYFLSDIVKPQRGDAYNYDSDSLTQILDEFVRRVQDLQTEWKIVRQRLEKVTKKGLLEKFQDAHGRELQGYSPRRLNNILTDNPRIVAADLAADATGLDASVFKRAKAHQTKISGR